MKSRNQGLLIACEGIDGSGKSTLAQKLFSFFCAQKIPTRLTKEPGGTQFGTHLREILQNPRVKRCAQAEFLLFAADRAQHFHEVILPELAQGTLIISDRLADSSLVYQGFGRGLDRTMITTINAWAMNSYKPDITIYLRVNAQTAFERMKKRNEETTAFEQESKEFFNRLIHGFDSLYAHRSDVIILDGDKNEEEILQEAVKRLTHHQRMKEITHD